MSKNKYTKRLSDLKHCVLYTMSYGWRGKSIEVNKQEMNYKFRKDWRVLTSEGKISLK